MNARPNSDVPAPAPEWLAAFADGELAPAERLAVEGRLAEDAALRAEVEAQRRLTEVWRASAPAEPSAEAWSAVLQRVEVDVRRGRQPVARRRARPTWLFALAATAAAVLAAVFFGRPGVPIPTPAGPPLPVVTEDDVGIVSMHADDVKALVVGQPPVQGPLEVASADDIQVQDTGFDVEVVIPESDQPGGPAPPTMMVPLEGSIAQP
jgi:anti-sigma factor RsiW